MSLLLQNVRVLDDRGELGRKDIEIRQGRFHRVLPVSTSREASPLRVIDGEGAYALPGLIDLHVHLVWDGSQDPVEALRRERREETLLRAVRNARQTLDAGITTVRDLGSIEDMAIYLSSAVERGYIAGPRIFASGRTIVMSGGHDAFWGITADGADEILKATRCQISRGAKVIKTCATGGVYGREGESMLDEELSYGEMRVMVDEAHRRRIPVAAHAIAQKGIANAVAAGVDTIEHGHQLSQSLAREFAARNGTLVPTLFVYRQIAKQPGIPEYAQEKAEAILGDHEQSVRLARMVGLRIGAGTDAGSPLTPHGSIVDELLSLVDAGLSPIEALKSVTYDAAMALGRGCDLGRIEPGYFADFILVPENPLSDLRRLKAPLSVWKEGRKVSGMW